MAFGLDKLVMGLLVLGIVLGVTFVVLAENHTQIVSLSGGTTTHAANASTAVQTGLSGVPTWIPLLVLVVMAGVIVGVVKGSFGGGRG